MMLLMDLFSRNLSSAIRETLNTLVVAQKTQDAAGMRDGHPHVPDTVLKKINEARLLLESAQEEVKQ